MLTLSARALAGRVRARDVSAREVVETHIAQIVRANPRLNAVVAERFEEARAEADAADALVGAGGDLPPLLGVPCTVKETFALTGMPNTAGLVSRVGHPAVTDAVTVARIRAAGAIPLGVTNVSELAMWFESDNRVYGRTNNPYDVTRIVGGSSGGEGAAVGAGFAPFGVGSDIGGSIRMPAFFNGVFGHKPSAGLVPNDGQFPVDNDPQMLRYQCTGPLTRHAEDLLPLLRILAGPDAEIGDADAVDLSALDVVTVEGNGARTVSPDLVAAQRRAVASLRALGARVRPASVPALKRSFDIWGAMLSASREVPFRTLLAGGGDFSTAREVGRFLRGRSPHTLPALGLAVVERWPDLLPGRGRRFVAMGEALREELTALVGDGVLFYPSFPTVAPRHNHPLRTPFAFAYTAILNVAELPATQVPLGLDAAGLPLGVQVAAAPGNDHLTIAVARHLEEAFGGWVPPRGVVPTEAVR
ncbi:MAG: fatty acid amide hydrolase 2 [Frankiaceae bacterium]|jgi:fatty acid amide hydrolase 2|nr:fatty acid amide hydrolase 2 [Frankiaceae bacterium]